MNTRITLMISADNLLVRAGLNAALGTEKDIEVIAESAEDSDLLSRVTKHRPNVLLLAVTSGDASTLHLIEQVKAGLDATAVFVISLCRDERYATACLGAGATGLINTSHDPAELADAIRKVAKGERFIRSKLHNKSTRAPSGQASDKADGAAGAVPPSNVDYDPVDVELRQLGHKLQPLKHFSLGGSSATRPTCKKEESYRILAPLTSAMDELAEELDFLTAHDALTGLVNRREFERRLESAVQENDSPDVEHSLLYLDLDQFKVINTCGHVAGDLLLRQVAELLHRYTRTSDLLARLGGDEFAVLLYGCPVGAATRIAELIRQLIAGVEFAWEDRRFGISASIGVVTFAGATLRSEEILSAADSACFLAKEKGRNRVQVYTPNDSELSVRLQEMNWVSRLREALKHKRLTLYAQDIVPIGSSDCKLARRELLVRLEEEDGSITPPMAFIPAAERYNLMPEVDRYVIKAAFTHFRSLADTQQDISSYWINLSGATLNDESFPAFVQEQATKHGLAAERICFEITETAAIANLARTAEMITTLRSQGFQFALDDFGRGMSSLAYLKCLPVDYLKIDGGFIKGLLEDEVDGTIVRAISSIAHTVGIRTVAEFVENDAVLELLEKLGVDFAQGFGIHKPEPLAALPIKTDDADVTR
jgi:diguanylate cyclase (GGDEF)-like protein